MRSHLIVASLFLVSISQSFAGGACPDANVFSTDPNPIPAQASWRSAITNLNQDGTVSKSTVRREQKIEFVVDDQVHDTTVAGQTPGMEFFPASGVRQKMLRETPGYGSHVTNQIRVSNVGPSGVLEGTLVLPVSGHVGTDKAKIWAVTDTYSVLYKPGTYDYSFFNNAQNLVKDVKSLGPATVQEVKVPLVKDQVVTIVYNRKGSAGPAGYVEGRVLEIVWDGT
jgi:hypothetical protein